MTIKKNATRKEEIERSKFQQQKYMAKRRGIEFLFTFEEWIKMWEDSGKWNERGRGAKKYCMARHNDIGPYAVGNVSIQTNQENWLFAVSNRNNSKWYPAVVDARKNPEWRAKITSTGNGQFKGPVRGTCKTTGKQIIISGKNEIINAGFQHQHVYKCVNGKLKSHKGYTWERI